MAFCRWVSWFILLLAATCDARFLRALKVPPEKTETASHDKRPSDESDEDKVYKVTELLDELKATASERADSVRTRFDKQRERLAMALERTKPGSGDRKAVEQVMNQSAKDSSQVQVAATEMMEFYYTAKAMLGSQSTAPNCGFLACGVHAVCVDSSRGSRCECKPCYKGDGFRCRPTPCSPATIGSALPIRGDLPAGYPVVPRDTTGKVGEIAIDVFGEDRVVLVVRESSQGNHGFLMMGQIADTEVSWGKKQLLHPVLETHGLVIKVSSLGRLLIGFRDHNRDGVGYLIGGQASTTGADLRVLLSTPHAIARSQAQKMALVLLESSKVVCLYAENLVGQDGRATHNFGGAVLAEVLAGGPIRVLGVYRFFEGMPVSRLAAVALSANSLLVAFRALHPPKAPSGQPSHELSAIWIGMLGSELLIDPHPIALEPEHADMWARDLALVAKDTVAYTYTGSQKVTKMTIIHVDPKNHRMTVLENGREIVRGTPKYLHSVSLPGAPDIPSTFTIFQRAEEACMAEVCRVSPQGRVADCRQVPWADQELRSVSASRLRDGRLIVGFANMDGEAYYQLLSAEEHGAMLDFGQ